MCHFYSLKCSRKTWFIIYQHYYLVIYHCISQLFHWSISTKSKIPQNALLTQTHLKLILLVFGSLVKGPVISEPPDVIELVEAFDVVRHSVSLQHVLALWDGGYGVDLQVWKQWKLRKMQERQSESERKRVMRRKCCRLKRTGILQWPGRTWGNRRHAHGQDRHTQAGEACVCVGDSPAISFVFHKSGQWPHTHFIFTSTWKQWPAKDILTEAQTIKHGWHTMLHIKETKGTKSSNYLSTNNWWQEMLSCQLVWPALLVLLPTYVRTHKHSKEDTHTHHIWHSYSQKKNMRRKWQNTRLFMLRFYVTYGG